MGVTVTKDKTANLKQAMDALLKTQVLVGVPDINATREPEEGEKSAPSNAAIAYWMEFGVPESNIPARPFLLPGMDSVKSQIAKHLGVAAERALTGDLRSINVEQNKVGLIVSSAVQMKITDGPFVPLAPRTLAARRKRGHTGEKPLIESGQLRRSITYVVRKKGS